MARYKLPEPAKPVGGSFNHIRIIGSLFIDLRSLFLLLLLLLHLLFLFLGFVILYFSCFFSL